MSELELSAGTIEYDDTGGSGPVVVLLHGLLMDSSLWTRVSADLSRDHRCVSPTLPFGAHRRAIGAGAALTLRSVAGLVVELIERLQLEDVTLVGNDTGGALVQLLAAEGVECIGRIVLVSCDAFENYPPGLTGWALVTAGKLPPALFGAFMQPMRLKPVRRLPLAFGALTKRGDAATADWLKPILTSREIRRDTVRVLRSISREPQLLVETASSLASFGRPALVAWAADDRVMPPEHGRRLAEILPDSRLVEIPDSYTLIPLDQPAKLATAIREFTAPSGVEAPGATRSANDGHDAGRGTTPPV